ncbi:von Willebrand factor A domain-containing protein 7-like [Stylophora pistillata]|uniref:von Willebrand factor A domain-containing protein 7-like n=2 Tax=Stylophora pistillata TaxID=50429 RepID=UPI000C049908|nr:von Willebrand factor A domain-containing protein 7-like [Stylophora pistillata]
MEKRILMIRAATILLLSMAVEKSSENLLPSLQFTRDTLMGFSMGSEREVKILTPKKTTKEIPNRDNSNVKNTGVKIFTKKFMKGKGGKKVFKGASGPKPGISPSGHGTVIPATRKPVTQTVITYQRKRKTYRPRATPSNKFLEAINDIERAVANARASGVRYNGDTLPKLKRLIVRAIRSKSYKYAREVLGQIMYILSSKSSPPRRGKRASENSANQSKQFIQGLRTQLGSSTFDSFMAVQGDVSLMFVIDDTGSMGDEIQATKNIAIDIINYPRQAPVEYILSPFNDPLPGESLSPVVVLDEIEAGEFVKAINNLTPHKGGDCPEYAFTGMLEALYQEPQWGSPMYVFTDAGPKDATDEYIEEVKHLAGAEEYGVTINFFTTGECNDNLSFYLFSSRNVCSLVLSDSVTEQYKPLTGGVLEGTNVISVGSNMSGRKKRNVDRARSSRYSIPVDESIEKLIISVTTTKIYTKGKGITLTDPDNIVITSGKRSLSQISVYQIDNPKKGGWTLAVSGSNGGHEFYVKSTSETNVDFEHYFLIPLSRRRRRETSEVPISNPVIGKANKVVITVAGSEKVNSSSVRLELITTEGTRISDVTLQTADHVHFTSSFTPRATQPFKFKLRGITRGGNPFERISHQTIKPTTVVLRGKYASNDYTLPLGRVSFVHFQLCNFGASEFFDVTTVKDKMGYLLSRNVRSRRVTKGRCATLSVRAKATRPTDVDKTDIVFLIAKGQTSKVVASQAMRLFVVS